MRRLLLKVNREGEARTPSELGEVATRRREESRRGTHECVRHE